MATSSLLTNLIGYRLKDSSIKRPLLISPTELEIFMPHMPEHKMPPKQEMVILTGVTVLPLGSTIRVHPLVQAKNFVQAKEYVTEDQTELTVLIRNPYDADVIIRGGDLLCRIELVQ